MTSERQFSLLPECSDEIRSLLHGFEVISGELTNFANGGKAAIGDLVFLDVSPNGVDGIEFGRVGRQACHGDMAVLSLQPGLNLVAAMRSGTVPDDQQRSCDLTFERAEKFDDLLRADRAGKETEIELPERQAGNGRQLLPGKAALKD